MSDVQYTSDDHAAALAGGGRLRAEIANALVRFYKEHYGRGPTMARAFVEERFIFVVLENGFTRSELTLIQAGQQELVSSTRQHFSDVVEPSLRRIVEELTGRRTIGHSSQVGFDPPRIFEIFELDDPVG